MSLTRAWNEFWFQPQPLAGLALFRIAIGLVSLMKLVLLWPGLNDYFSEEGVVTLAQAIAALPKPRLCLFEFLPPDSAPAMFAVLFVVAVCFTVGLWTRVMAALLYVGMLSIDNRNLWIINNGDKLLAILLFYAMLAPLGAAGSLDRLIALARGRAAPGAARGSFWAARLIQIQLCLVYFWSAYIKIHGPMWESGEAVYWVTRNLQRVRWPLPPVLTETMLGINGLTYGTMLVEGLFPILVWPRRTRGLMLFLGLVLHLGMEWAMTIQVFQYVTLAPYLLFVDGERVAEAWRRLCQRVFNTRPSPVFYDGGCGFCTRSVHVLQALDVCGRLACHNFRDPAVQKAYPDLDLARAQRELVVRDRRGRWHGGFFAYRWMAWRLPLAWPLAPLLYLPGVSWAGDRIYRWIAAHRHPASCSV